MGSSDSFNRLFQHIKLADISDGCVFCSPSCWERLELLPLGYRFELAIHENVFTKIATSIKSVIAPDSYLNLIRFVSLFTL